MKAQKSFTLKSSEGRKEKVSIKQSFFLSAKGFPFYTTLKGSKTHVCQWKMAYVFHRYGDMHKHMMQFAASRHSQSPSQKMSREKNGLLSERVQISVWAKQYQMFESICCLFGGIITTYCFYVALSPIKFTAWRREREGVCKKSLGFPHESQTMTTVTEGRKLCRVMNRWCRSDENSGSLFDWECWRRIKNLKFSQEFFNIYSCSCHFNLFLPWNTHGRTFVQWLGNVRLQKWRKKKKAS